jgi:hypothetical protein
VPIAVSLTLLVPVPVRTFFSCISMERIRQPSVLFFGGHQLWTGMGESGGSTFVGVGCVMDVHGLVHHSRTKQHGVYFGSR